MRHSLSVLLCTGVCFGQWPTPKTANEAYDFVQEQRSTARKLWSSRDQRGVDILVETLPYLDLPLIRDLAAGSLYLSARRLNIYIDLAEAYALQGKPRESLDYLQEVLAAAPNPEIAKYIERQKSFDTLREDPEFKQLLVQFRRYEALWDSKALSTPFRETSAMLRNWRDSENSGRRSSTTSGIPRS